MSTFVIELEVAGEVVRKETIDSHQLQDYIKRYKVYTKTLAGKYWEIHYRRKSAVNIINSRLKLSEQQMDEIKRLHTVMKNRDLCRLFDVSEWTICKIIRQAS